MSSFLESFRSQRRVLGALLIREVITRYGRHNIGFLWLFVEPMLFTVGVTALWSALKEYHGSSLPIAAFGLTGYSSVLIWRNMPARCINSIQPNLSLLYHRHVKVADIFLSRVLLEALGGAMSFFVLTIFFWGAGWIDLPEDVLIVLQGWLLLAWFGGGLGITLAALNEFSEVVEKIWHPLAYFLFPLSGAAFTVDALPTYVRELVLVLPMVHGVEIVREGFFGSRYSPHYDAGYLIICCLFLSFTAFGLTWMVSKRVTPE